MESSRPWPWPRGASRTTGHVLGHGLGKHVLSLKYFSVLWLKLTVNFITNFENLAIKMKLVITSPAINACVLKFWLTEQWTMLTLALTPSCLGLGVFGLEAPRGQHWSCPWPWPWPWGPSPWHWPWPRKTCTWPWPWRPRSWPWPWPWGLWPWLQVSK